MRRKSYVRDDHVTLARLTFGQLRPFAAQPPPPKSRYSGVKFSALDLDFTRRQNVRLNLLDGRRDYYHAVNSIARLAVSISVHPETHCGASLV
jgi:hypothetical protein